MCIRDRSEREDASESSFIDAVGLCSEIHAPPTSQDVLDFICEQSLECGFPNLFSALHII